MKRKACYKDLFRVRIGDGPTDGALLDEPGESVKERFGKL